MLYLFCLSSYDFIFMVFYFFIVYFFFFFFFFFQAEDGIRDTSVTGVQTCALPISTENLIRLNFSLKNFRPSSMLNSDVRTYILVGIALPVKTRVKPLIISRSEERRVGKECIYRCVKKE